MRLGDFITKEGFEAIDCINITFYSVTEVRTISKFRSMFSFPEYDNIKDIEYDKISIHTIRGSSFSVMALDLLVTVDAEKNEKLFNKYVSGANSQSTVSDVIDTATTLFNNSFDAIRVTFLLNSNGSKVTFSTRYADSDSYPFKVMMNILDSIDQTLWLDPNFVESVSISESTDNDGKCKLIEMTVRAYMSPELVGMIEETREEMKKESENETY